MSLQEHMQIFTLYLVLNTLAGCYTRKEIASLRFLKRFQQSTKVPAIKPSPGPVYGESPAGSPPWLSPLHAPLNAAIQSRLGKVLTV